MPDRSSFFRVLVTLVVVIIAAAFLDRDDEHGIYRFLGLTAYGRLCQYENLLAQAEEGDAYGSSVIGSAALGYASKGEVLGETGLDSVVAEVPSSELHAQFALVKAAKDEVRGPTSRTFAALRAAHTTLAAVSKRGSAGR